MFYLVDARNYRRAPKLVREQLAEPEDQWRFEGLGNLGYLAIILGAVFINNPPLLREVLMLGAALGSWFTTRKSIHEANHFNFHPIKEVGILFVGIFATMMPALDYLRIHAAQMGTPTPAFFYWSSGTLSSVLDNAPTYLTFLSASLGAYAPPEVVQQVQNLLAAAGGLPDPAGITGPNAEAIRYALAGLQKYHPAELAAGTITAEQIGICLLLGNPALNNYVVAVSIGAVFFGANTYIGNGPNFMVKAIADHQKVHTPTFLGYVFKYTLPFMAPMLLLIWLLFFRG
jgi:Na+/H+ antiporter NhaD/arsenite permease-like protein